MTQVAQQQFEEGLPWSVVPGAEVEGGHYVPLMAKRDMPVCVIWGHTQKMTEEFLVTYATEAFLPITEEILNGKGLSPEGFNWPSSRLI